MIKLIIISFILLSVSMLAMGISILVRKKGRFPAYQVGHNKNMKKMGISCVKHEEIKCHKRSKGTQSGCPGCGSISD